MSQPPGDEALGHTIADLRIASLGDQVVADADQAAADGDQTSSDGDQTASDTDQDGADRDQQASDLDQAAADKARAALRDRSLAEELAYEGSRQRRLHASFARLDSRFGRLASARDRHQTATERDRLAEIRDEGGRRRDAHAAGLDLPSSERDALLQRQLTDLRIQAAIDRAAAAEDRARAAADRANAAGERTRLEAELRAAHLDGLTGAYRPEMGRLAISHEIERARRSGKPLVVAFVDVDELKAVNDREGHAAGDRVLELVVRAMRARLRSFDPIVRYGGDEFVCGLGGSGLAEAERRFDLIRGAIEADASVGISVGLAELEVGDTADQLTERADAAMLGDKAARRAQSLRTPRPH